jgi:hypothetical protein
MTQSPAVGRKRNLALCGGILSEMVKCKVVFAGALLQPSIEFQRTLKDLFDYWMSVVA